jgi:hypothetical protein
MKSFSQRKTLPNTDISYPDNLDIVMVKDQHELWTELGARTFSNKGETRLLGTAYVQGNRLFFTCAASVMDYLSICHLDNARRGDTVSIVQDRMNRPHDPGHLRRTTDYLTSCAATGGPFILPSFVLNYGVHTDISDNVDEAESAFNRALLLVVNRPQMLTAQALLIIPEGVRLPTTDGSHRTKALHASIRRLEGKNGDKAALDRLRANALPLIIAFEDRQRQAHQDFADCATTKPMAASVRSVYDTRDVSARVAMELIKSVPFLLERVDGTAQGYNVAAKSRHIYTMVSIRAHVEKIRELDILSGIPPEGLDVGNLIRFWEKLTASLPVFKEVKNTSAEEVRKFRGGSIWMKPAGLALLSSAFWEAMAHKADLDFVVEKLSELDDKLFTMQFVDFDAWAAMAKVFDAEGNKIGLYDCRSSVLNPVWMPFWKVGHDKATIASTPESVRLVWDTSIAEKLGFKPEGSGPAKAA